MMIRFAIEVQGKKKTTDREIRHLENEIEVRFRFQSTLENLLILNLCTQTLENLENEIEVQFSVNLSADRLLKVLL